MDDWVTCWICNGLRRIPTGETITIQGKVGRKQVHCPACKGTGTASPSRVAVYPLGELGVSDKAREILEEHAVSPMMLFARHTLGDWADEDRICNAAAKENGTYLLSRFEMAWGRIYVYTDPAHEHTIILWPQTDWNEAEA